jgi:hypothetical protein
VVFWRGSWAHQRERDERAGSNIPLGAYHDAVAIALLFFFLTAKITSGTGQRDISRRSLPGRALMLGFAVVGLMTYRRDRAGRLKVISEEL